MMNKRGFTLMELLVYMAIVGIVVVIAGQVYSDSTKMRVRTQSMIAASEVAENVGMLLRDDVGQMGAKNSKEQSSTTTDSFYVAKDVYMDPDNSDKDKLDSSSFYLAKSESDGNRMDSLYFRRLRYDDQGRYVAVEAVSWYARGGKLYRSCKTIAQSSLSSSFDECPKSSALEVVAAEGVEQFKVVPSKPSILSTATNTLLLPKSDTTKIRLLSRVDGTKYFRATTSPEAGGTSVTISSFVSNYDFDEDQTTTEKKANELYVAEANGNVGTWSDLCSKVTLYPDSTYELTYYVPRVSEKDNSQTFVPGKDHMAVGFRTSNGNAVADLKDFFFYPSTSEKAGTINRTIRFKVKQKAENVCLAFTFAAYTPLMASGSVTIGDLKLRKVSDMDYVFDDGHTFTTADKAHVRAFQLNVSVKKNKEQGQATIVIPVPSNGPAR